VRYRLIRGACRSDLPRERFRPMTLLGSGVCIAAMEDDCLIDYSITSSARALARPDKFERAMIQERVHAGLKRAAAEGKFPGRPTVGLEKENAIRECLAQGFGLIKTANTVGVGVSVVQRVRAAIDQRARNGPL
jgi:DNA invertase Pin-like site-specific DNA recombinase